MNLIKQDLHTNVAQLILWSTFLFMGCITYFLSGLKIVDNEGLAISTIIAMSLLVIFVIVKVMSTNLSRMISLSGYIIIILLMFYDRYIHSLDSTDPDGFHQCALLKSFGIDLWDYGGCYTDLLAIIYRLFGRQRIIGQYFNALLVVTIELICVKMYRLLELNVRIEALGIAMITLTPNFLLINSTLRREAVIETLLAFSLYYFVKWYRYRRLHCFIIAVSFSLIACAFHAGCIAVVSGYSLFFILHNLLRNKVKFKISEVIFFGVLIVFIYYLDINYGQFLFEKFHTDRSVSQLMGSASIGKGGSGYNIELITTGNELVDLIINSPIRMAYYLLAPMPWDWRGIKDVMAFGFSSMFYFVGYVFAIKAVKCKNSDEGKKNIIRALLTLMIFTCFVFGWGVKNAGTAMRHRDKFIVPYVLMTILSVDLLKGENFFFGKRSLVITLKKPIHKVNGRSRG